MKHANDTHLDQQKLQVVAPASSSSPGLSSHLAEPLALMACGEFSLLIASKDIVTLISAQKIVSAQKILPSKAASACGEIEFNQQTVPVFALNKALQLQPQLPSVEMILVVLQYESCLFALCCSELEKLNASDLHFYPVPQSMSSRKQPFAEFAIVNHVAAGLTSAAELWRLLSLRNAVQAMLREPVQIRIQGAS